MAKPIFHAESSARRFGGTPEDYLPIHDLMDSSKGAVADNRHRALTHNAWFLSNIIERVFGHTITVTLRVEDRVGKTIPADKRATAFSCSC